MHIVAHQMSARCAPSRCSAEPSQKYEPHFDYFHDAENVRNGGQRIATMLMYLSDVQEGGETVFPSSPEKPVRAPGLVSGLGLGSTAQRQPDFCFVFALQSKRWRLESGVWVTVR